MAARHRSQGTDQEVFSGAPAGGSAKVPAVKPYFWALKLLTTAMGEAISDYMAATFNQYLAVFVGFLIFVVAITWQFRTRGYRTWPYWAAVSSVAIFGTMCADGLHIQFGVPYKVTSALFAACLVVVLAAWYLVEGTLDIHSIVTPRREVFYWLTIVSTFALGTALGDFTATTLKLGYLTAAFGFIGLIIVPLVAWRLGVNSVLTFWVAYILTRPIGASFADFFGQPKSSSGMGYGHLPVAGVTFILVVAFIVYLSRSGIDRMEGAPSATPTAPSGYEQPQYARPQYGQPAAQPAQYGNPQYGNPQYGDPRQGQPLYGQQPLDGQYGQPQAPRPQYREQPRYPDERDYR